jgi:hypothetical protein
LESDDDQEFSLIGEAALGLPRRSSVRSHTLIIHSNQQRNLEAVRRYADD